MVRANVVRKGVRQRLIYSGAYSQGMLHLYNKVERQLVQPHLPPYRRLMTWMTRWKRTLVLVQTQMELYHNIIYYPDHLPRIDHMPP
jgi:hypothetical protein